MTSMVNFSLLLCWSAVNITAIGYFMLKQRSGNYLRDLAWLGLGVLFAAWLKYVRRVDLSFAVGFEVHRGQGVSVRAKESR